MSIFENIFGAKPAAPAAAPTAAPAATPTPAAPEAAPQSAAPEASPLDPFKDLFKIEPPKADAQGESNPFAIDTDAIFNGAKQTDFTKAIDNETLAKIGAGGEEAQQAFLVAMNRMNQMSYAYSAMLATKMAEQATSHVMQRVQTLVPDLVKQLRVNEEFSDSHPALNHPAAAPMLQAITSQVRQKYPDASPREVKKIAEDYVVKFGQLFNPQTDNVGLVDKTGASQRKPANPDWSLFLNS